MVIDWYIGIALTAPSIFLTDILPRVMVVRAYFYRRRRLSGISIKALIEENAQGMTGPRRRQLLISALSIYKAHHALSSALDRRIPADEESNALQHALVDFGRAATDSPDVAARYSVDNIARETMNSANSEYPFNKGSFEADLLRACLGTGMTHTEAARTTHLIACSDRREHAAARAREAAREVQEGMHAARTRDMLAIFVVCVLWAAFQLARPWLYWTGLDHGRKAGCTLQLMWFFVPTSTYSEKFRIWLKAWAVVMSVVGVATFSYGVMALAKNVLAMGKLGRSGFFSWDVESRGSLMGSVSERSGSSQSTDASLLHRKGRASRPCRAYFRCLGVLHFIVLGIVAGMVEGTIWVNHIDMEARDLTTSSQIFALVLGVMASVPVYWDCLVIKPLEWATRRRK